MSLRALIAEDEPILAATLANALQRLWPDLEIVALCPNGLDAVEQALALRPDVLFFDIKMPGQTGLEAAEELAERWDGSKPFPQVVFVTAYDDYAVNAFEQAAADYVMKPVDDARLGKTIERLRQRLAAPGDGLAQLVEQVRRALPAMPAQERLATIRAAVGNQVRMIPVPEVVYFQAVDKYVNVVTADGEALIRVSLKDLLPQVDPERFCQVHRGTIVNMACIASATRDELGKMTLTLRNRPEKLKVSLLYAHLFRPM
ncbi:MAG: LytR/AlgR family response regulator transcription factor [Ramlibacter sp.]